MSDFKKRIKEAIDLTTSFTPQPPSKDVMAKAAAAKSRMAAKNKIEREKAKEAIIYAIGLAESGVSSALIVPSMSEVLYLKNLFVGTKEVQSLEIIKHRDDGVDLSNNTMIRFMPKATASNAPMILGEDVSGKKRDYKIVDVQDFEGDPDMEIFADVFGWT